MSRLRKIIFDALVIVSLVLFVATAILWLKSYYRAKGVCFVTRRHDYGIIASRGEVLLYNYLHDGAVVKHERGLHYADNDDLDLPKLLHLKSQGVAGFFVLTQLSGYSDIWPTRGVILPYWFAMALCALLPLKWQFNSWKKKRKSPGMCATCGYDLRATPDRCPECGMVPPRVKA